MAYSSLMPHDYHLILRHHTKHNNKNDTIFLRCNNRSGVYRKAKPILPHQLNAPLCTSTKKVRVLGRSGNTSGTTTGTTLQRRDLRSVDCITKVCACGQRLKHHLNHPIRSYGIRARRESYDIMSYNTESF